MSKNQLPKFCSVLNGESFGKRSESLLSSTVCGLSSKWLVVRFRAVFQEFCVQPEVTILHLSEEFCSFRRAQRYSLRRNQDPALLLYYCFLTDPLLFLHSFPSLVSNCLNLIFGMQRRLRKLNEAQFLQTKNSAWKVFVPGRAPRRILLSFSLNV